MLAYRGQKGYADASRRRCLARGDTMIEWLMHLVWSDTFMLFAQSGTGSSPWATWPFGPGYEGGFWWTVSRYALIAVFLGIIIVVLRIFFGPGGRLRGDIDDHKDEPGSPGDSGKSRNPRR
jgi:hypothetical protein